MEEVVTDPLFWSNKKVLITGHTGFKGSWLSLWLQFLGAKVVGFALPPPTNPNLFEVGRVGEEMDSIIGDIRDLARVQAVFSEHRPEIVIHMAAQPLVRYSYNNPIETYATNVMGTAHLLEAARQVGSVRAIINVTSDKCYENREWIWGYRENEPMGGYDPYSSSKGCAELVTSAYRNSYFNLDTYNQHGVAVATARAGNVIGGGDWALDRLIPDAMRAIQAGESIRIRSPHAIRPWQHVLEPLSGYLRLAKKLYEDGPIYAESWNFGPSDEDTKPVQWIVEELTRQWGEGACWELNGDIQPHEANYLKLDCSKAKSRLGWRPRWDLVKALENIIVWHRAYIGQSDMKDVTLRQIQIYSGGVND